MEILGGLIFLLLFPVSFNTCFFPGKTLPAKMKFTKKKFDERDEGLYSLVCISRELRADLRNDIKFIALSFLGIRRLS